MLTETLTEDDRWPDDLADWAESSARCALLHLGLNPDQLEIAVLACDDARIAALNGAFRGKPSATNVLSWPAFDLSAEKDGADPDPVDPLPEEIPLFLGDMAVAFETCDREARTGAKPLEAHMRHLFVHGTLHLLGYDHVRDGDATLMERLEVEILGKLGVSDPYIGDTGPQGPLTCD